MYYVEYWNETGLRQREGAELLVAASDALTVVAFENAPAPGDVWDSTAHAFATPASASAGDVPPSAFAKLVDHLETKGLLTADEKAGILATPESSDG